MASTQEVAAEALCSAFYNMPFGVFLGERTLAGDGAVAPVVWFKLCREGSEAKTGRDDPKQVMVAVRQDPEGVVVVQAGWLNLSGPEILKASQNFALLTTDVAEADVRMQTEQVVLRVLSIYTDVLEGTGVAGPIDLIAPESEAGDPDDPDDMAVPE